MQSRSRSALRGCFLVLFASTCLVPPAAFAAGQLLGPSAATSDKPQSKIWYNDGFYWTVFQASGGSHIYKLVNGNWTQQQFVDSRSDTGDAGHEDVLWNGTHLFILVYSSNPKIYKYTYDSGADVYNLLPGFPVILSTPNGTETMVIDQDGSGRVWAAFEAGGTIYAAYSTSADHTMWESPGVVLRSGVNDDDIASVVRYGTKVGVFWSDQNRWEFGFRSHAANDPPTTWSSVEVVYAGSGNSDDHLNLAADSNGRIYAITKDAHNEFAVHRRETTGKWTTKANITAGQTGTRPVIMLDDTETKLYALYTCWSCSGSDPILYRVGSTSTLSFGSPTTFITGTSSLNNVTDMKQILPPNSMIAIAQGGGNAYWNGWGSPPPGSGSSGGTTQPPPPPPALLPPGAPAGLVVAEASRHATPGVAADYFFDEPTGEDVLNDAGIHGLGRLGAPGADSDEPQRVAGLIGGALRFDGAGDYVEIADTPELGFAASFTLEAWIRHPIGGSPDVIASKEGSGRNYRFRITKDDVLELGWKSTSGSSRTTTGTRKLVDEAWHHVAAVRDVERGEDRLYIDGILEVRRSDSSSPGLCSDPIVLGARRSSSNLTEFFRGDLDLVRLSSVAAYDADFVPATSYPMGPSTPYAYLVWSTPATGGAPTGYRIYRSTNAEDEQEITASPASGVTYADFTAVDGVLAYRVSAVNSEGEGPKSELVSIVFGRGPTPPAASGEPSVQIVHRLEPVQGSAIYPLDEGSGSASADASEHGFDLTLGSSSIGDAKEPTWIDGVAGRALRFDGIDDYASAPDDAGLRFEGSFTVEAWVRMQQIGTYGVILAKESTDAGRNYRLAVTATGALELQWKNGSGTSNLLTSTRTLTLDTWHHVAGIFDEEAAQNRLFIDGQLAGTSASAGTPQTGSTMLRIGARQSTTSIKDRFRGDIDLVRVTSKALYVAAFTPVTAYGPRPIVEHRITWSESQPGSARLAGYELQRCLEDGSWNALVTAPTGDLSFDVEETTREKTCYRVIAVDRLGLRSTPCTARCVYWKQPPELASAKAAPWTGFHVSAGPNPFNPTTTITLRIDRSGPAEARIYDVTGRVVCTLVSATLPAGEHRFTWDGRDTRGTRVASGIYFLRATTGEETRKLKLVMTK